jgi:predicted nucleic acid-binding protein
MSARIIVDTSVWSLALRRRPKAVSSAERALSHLLRDMIIDGHVILIGVVRQELLTGINDPDAFENIRQYLHDFDDFPPDADDYERAAAFANQCQAAGIAATTVDMLLCSLAAGRELPILTTDRDFDHYRQHLPIRLYPRP